MTNPRKPLRITIADSVRVWAGAQRFVLEVLEGLAARGHSMTLHTFPESPLHVRARDAGIKVRPIPIRVDAAPWQVLPLAQGFRREPSDVVMATWDKDLRVSGLAARLSRSVPLIVNSRECDGPVKGRPQYRWFYTNVANRILVNSNATLQTTLQSATWMNPDHVGVLPKGIDLDPYRDMPLPTATPSVILGYAGQLVARKRIDVLLRALADPRLRSLPWTLQIAGRGPSEPELRTLVAQLDLADRVMFCGFVANVPAWMGGIDVLVLPSLIEGFGYVLAEAAAAGRPSVAYASSSVPEVVVDGVTGLLAAPGDEAALVEPLARLIGDPELRVKMAGAARDHAWSAFGLDLMLDRLENLYYTWLSEVAPSTSPLAARVGESAAPTPPK